MLGLDQAKCLHRLLFISLIAPSSSKVPLWTVITEMLMNRKKYLHCKEKETVFELLYLRSPHHPHKANVSAYWTGHKSGPSFSPPAWDSVISVLWDVCFPLVVIERRGIFPHVCLSVSAFPGPQKCVCVPDVSACSQSSRTEQLLHCHPATPKSTTTKPWIPAVHKGWKWNESS